jgi:hypothetical protein
MFFSYYHEDHEGHEEKKLFDGMRRIDRISLLLLYLCANSKEKIKIQKLQNDSIES